MHGEGENAGWEGRVIGSGMQLGLTPPWTWERLLGWSRILSCEVLVVFESVMGCGPRLIQV